MGRNNSASNEPVTVRPSFQGNDGEEFNLTKIGQLEAELHQKANELNEILATQDLLHEQMISIVNSLRSIEKQLCAVNAKIKHVNEYTAKLEQENRNLKLSCTEWINKSIQLQFEVLSARSVEK